MIYSSEGCADALVAAGRAAEADNCIDNAVFRQQHEEVERLRAALHEIISLDHHNHGPESRATKIARAALKTAE